MEAESIEVIFHPPKFTTFVSRRRPALCKPGIGSRQPARQIESLQRLTGNATLSLVAPFVEQPSSHIPASFPTTRWSVVRRAGTQDNHDAPQALAHLCDTYWHPLYAFVRRQGYAAHDAQDITQSFIVEMIRGPLLGQADARRGRFRSLVLSALKNFLLNADRFARAKRRGGHLEFVPLDTANEDFRSEIESFQDLTPEDHFQRNWALALLDRVLLRLRGEYEEAGRARLFEVLHSYLAGKEGQPGYAEVARQLGVSEGMIAVSVHRMRRRYGELLREQIATTVSSAQEVEEEIAELMAALALSRSTRAS